MVEGSCGYPSIIYLGKMVAVSQFHMPLGNARLKKPIR